MNLVNLNERKAFDYSIVENDKAELIRLYADDIRAKNETLMIEIGRALVEVKASLPHGSFGPWLEAEFGWSERTAQNLIAVYAAFGDKPRIVSALPAGLLYKLAAKSTPVEIRETVTATIEAGKTVATADVENLLWQAKEAAKEAKITPEQRAKEKASKKRREAYDKKQEEQWQAEKAEREKREAERVTKAADIILAAVSGEDLDTLIKILAECSAWNLKVELAFRRPQKPRPAGRTLEIQPFNAYAAAKSGEVRIIQPADMPKDEEPFTPPDFLLKDRDRPVA